MTPKIHILTLSFLSFAFMCVAEETHIYPQEVAKIESILKNSATHTNANYSISVILQDKKPFLRVTRTFQLAPGKKNVSIQEVDLRLLDPRHIVAMTAAIDIPGVKIRTKGNAPKVRMTTIIEADKVEPEEKGSEDKAFVTIVCDKKLVTDLQQAFEELLAKAN